MDWCAPNSIMYIKVIITNFRKRKFWAIFAESATYKKELCFLIKSVEHWTWNFKGQGYDIKVFLWLLIQDNDGLVGWEPYFSRHMQENAYWNFKTKKRVFWAEVQSINIIFISLKSMPFVNAYWFTFLWHISYVISISF